MFYYTIGNIRPELRSTQRTIQLIACVTSKNIEKYGYQAILKPFIDDVNKLARVLLFINSLTFLIILYNQLQDGIRIPNTDVVLHGTVLLLLADTMAAHQLCGFKVGVGRALRKCRDCNATYDLIQIKVSCRKFVVAMHTL